MPLLISTALAPRRPHRPLLLSVALSLAALMSACSSPPPAAAPSLQDIARSSTQSQALLQAHHWQLSGASDRSGGQRLSQWTVPGRPSLQLDFLEDRLSVKGLCNTLGAGYRLSAQGLDIERPISTMMACNEAGLMDLERRVATQLPLMRSYEFQGDPVNGPLTLRLSSADGQQWQFNGRPTPAARYGSAGERIFLEVAPQTVPCQPPLQAQARCLRVRELLYDAQGLRRGAADWQLMPSNIEGYEHRAGTRHVLRLQRYDLSRRGPLPADAGRYAYVLDMVVETELVR